MALICWAGCGHGVATHGVLGVASPLLGLEVLVVPSPTNGNSLLDQSSNNLIEAASLPILGGMVPAANWAADFAPAALAAS